MPGKADAARARVTAITEKHLDRIRNRGGRSNDLRILMAPHNVKRREERLERNGEVLKGRIEDLEERLEKLEKGADHGPPD